MNVKFYVPLAIVCTLSIFVGNITKSQMEYEAMVRVNQIQEQSYENVQAHQQYKDYLASIK